MCPCETRAKTECEQWLDEALSNVKRYVDPLIKVNINTLTQAALYSFVYNVGIGNFRRSTLLKKLNAGDRQGACDEMKRWVYDEGIKQKGLMTRREIESVICYGDLSHLS
ncbi:lysozyme [Arsenophonus sp. PmNCSU2021_1]|uniref:lysozyme n=1 Tax=Arsenophonus sp. PmNCSU2021_1 TaxID=3118989 RepID=UPI002FEFBF2C